MNSKPVPNKLASTSLILGILGWILYLLQWCFDLTFGLILTALTAGYGSLCTNVLDFLPFVLWLVSIVLGHTALGQIKQKAASSRRQAIWGLVLSYFGMVFAILLIFVIIVLVAAGIGTGVLGKIFPIIPKH